MKVRGRKDGTQYYVIFGKRSRRNLTKRQWRRIKRNLLSAHLLRLRLSGLYSAGIAIYSSNSDMILSLSIDGKLSIGRKSMNEEKLCGKGPPLSSAENLSKTMKNISKLQPSAQMAADGLRSFGQAMQNFSRPARQAQWRWKSND